MFRTKSKSEQVSEQVSAQAHTAAEQLAALKERMSPAAEVAKERAAHAKEWAKPHVDHGIEVAAPKLQGAVEGLAPKVDTARDKIVDDLLPKVAEAIAAVAAASAAAKQGASEVGDRAPAAYAVLKGEAVAKPKRRKGRLLLTLGFLAAAAAAAAAIKKSAPREDPWATPLDDPYTASTSSRTSTMAATREKVSHLAETAKDKAAHAAEAAKEKAAEASKAAGGAGAASTGSDVTEEPTIETTPASADTTTGVIDGSAAGTSEPGKDKLD